jgi:hypothetical protein
MSAREDHPSSSSRGSSSAADSVSIVLPVLGDESSLPGALESYIDGLRELGLQWEILLVPSAGNAGGRAYEKASAVAEGIRVCPAVDGWGAAVRAGLSASTGELLCYSNWRRTSAQSLGEMLSLALRNRTVALRANRRTRDTRVQRIGSLLFNLECRLILQVPAWDINGTPKIFPRSFGRLLELRRNDELIDAEFALVCEREGYPVIEVPVDATLHPGVTAGDTQNYLTALTMYRRVGELRASAVNR